MPINKNELTMERMRKALSGFSLCLLLLLLCGSSALAGDSPKYWYDKDGLFHEQHDSHAYANDEYGRCDRQVKVVTHSWYDREGNQHEITTTPDGTRENTIPAALSAKSRIRYFYDKKGIFHREYTFFTPRGDKDIELVWYGRDGRQYGKEYGYVVINGQYLYRESVTTYDAKGWRHINIFWIYPDKSRRDKHIWFDDRGERHEEWKSK